MSWLANKWLHQTAATAGDPSSVRWPNHEDRIQNEIHSQVLINHLVGR